MKHFWLALTVFAALNAGASVFADDEVALNDDPTTEQTGEGSEEKGNDTGDKE